MGDLRRRNFDLYLAEHANDIGHVVHDVWNARDGALWETVPYFYLTLAEAADRHGQVMFAHDVLREGLDHFPEDLPLVHRYCLSAVKCGHIVQARDLLTRLVRQGHDDEETLGILGRVYKEIWLLAGEEQSDLSALRKARTLYLRAFLKDGGYYSGINAASLSAVLGEWDRAQKIARRVLGICRREIASGKADHWVLATVGEACALLGNREESLRSYAAARSRSASNFSDLASMRRQLKLLRRVTPIAEEALEEIRIPPIVLFSGHMIDAPGRAVPRFPADAAQGVHERIAEVLKELGAEIGYSSAACGGDILFLEAMQARGGETNVALPFKREEFFEISVDFAGPEWHARGKSALSKAATVETATPGGYGSDNLLFTYTNRILAGKAILRSELLDTTPILLACWDGRRVRDRGGTSEVIEAWSRLGLPRRIIDIGVHRGKASLGAVLRSLVPARAHSAAEMPRGIRRQTVSILFADLVGYSRLSEDQIPYYIEGFLGSIAGRLKQIRRKPMFRNVWGDALYFVFREPLEAAEYALVLRDCVRDTNWQASGLPEHLEMRIGLHAGPVFAGREAVLGRRNFFGSHVNQAARIEPITSPGNVYASEQFVALLTAGDHNRLEYRYVGVITLPKEFGSYPIYHVRRRNEIE